MRVDFLGRMRKTALGDRNGLQAAFEAVINAVEAIEEGGVARGSISLLLKRDVAALSPEAHGNTIADLLSVVVSDNGIGFTSSNFASFDAVDSTYKASKGGKGVGRLLWLKAFEYVEIESTFTENGKWFHRRFEFRPTPQGIENPTLKELPGPGQRLTKVSLLGYRPQFQAVTVKSADAIGRRVVEHCLEYFILGRMPALEVVDPEEGVRVDLQELFRDQYQPETTVRSYVVADRPFQVRDVLITKDADLTHQLNFCANDRVVRTVPLIGRLEHLPPTIDGDDGSPKVFHAYVRSSLLDERVNPERTGFAFDRRDELALTGEATWDDVLDAAVKNAAQYLEPVTSAGRQRAIERTEQFIAEKAPRYRPLLAHRREALSRISADLPESKLDIELYRLHSDWRAELRNRTEQQLQSTQDSELEVGYRERLSTLLAEIEEASKAELVEYVVQRRAVLDLFQRLLGMQTAGRFAREDVLHDLMFPRRRTSNEVDYDTHNLWLIDERLAYHLHLASDKPLRSHGGPIEVAKDNRPDMLIYNRAIAFGDQKASVSSVVIVEFKRPERDDYTDSDNPIIQVIEYIEDLRAGRATREDGSSIDLPQRVPFYCYIVATRSDSLKREAIRQDFKPTPDDQGYFKFHGALNAYMEILSYHKVLDDAKKRNRAFFERLGLPIH